MCIFYAVKKQSGIEFIVDALFGNFAYLYNLFTVVLGAPSNNKTNKRLTTNDRLC